MSDVFLAYADEDRERARVLSDALARRGRSVDWQRNIALGKSEDDVVEAQLAAARCVIALWSAHSVDEPMVRAEARDALDHQKLIPVFIENVAAPLRFRGMPAARLVDWHGESDAPAFAELDNSISLMIGSAAPTMPLERRVGPKTTRSSAGWMRPGSMSSQAKITALLGVLALPPAALAVGKLAWVGVASAREWVYRDNAIDRNVSLLTRTDSSQNIVALDSLNLLVKNKPNRALRAYPGVLAFLTHRLPHRSAGAKDCSAAPPADARQPRDIALALIFLRENKRGAKPDSVDMSEIDLPGADLSAADLRRVNFKRACLAHAQLGATTLDGATFREADLRRADFHNATGAQVFFVGAHLDTATFTEAKLSGASFVDADLSNGGFQAAELSEAVFRGAKLERVNFAGAKLTNVSFDRWLDRPDSSRITGARFDDKTTGLSMGTQQWLRKFGACFDSLRVQTNTPGAPMVFQSDTACQCAEPVRTCKARRTITR
jgi:uncharacterized protein YjbI with pentapeptide repeats